MSAVDISRKLGTGRKKTLGATAVGITRESDERQSLLKDKQKSQRRLQRYVRSSKTC